MADLDFFLNLITSEYRNQPKYRAWASVLLQGLVDAQNVAASLPTIFDLETAIGVQLDKVGEWVGVTRFISELVPTFFSWNVPGLGWGQAPWYSPFSPQGRQSVILDDYHYRILLKARVASNYWDGTIEGAYVAWNQLFASEGYQVLIQNVGPKVSPLPGAFASDSMHILMALLGPPADPLTVALFNGGHLDLRPAGVQVDAYITQTVPGRPYFAWGVGPAAAGDYTAPPVNLAGWGMGAWGDFSGKPAAIVTPHYLLSDTAASLEGGLTRQPHAPAAVEIPQGIGSITLPTPNFAAGVSNQIISVINVSMWPAAPAFIGSLTFSGANSGGFVLGSSGGAPVIQQRSGGTAAGTYTDLVITASQPGLSPRSVSPVLVGT